MVLSWFGFINAPSSVPGVTPGRGHRATPAEGPGVRRSPGRVTVGLGLAAQTLDLVLELAVAAGCRTVVTHNVRDFRGAESLAVSAQRPGSFLKAIGVLS